MATDKNTMDQLNQPAPQQTQQDRATINPFRDAAEAAPQPTVEEESELEQQRKEALTERD